VADDLVGGGVAHGDGLADGVGCEPTAHEIGFHCDAHGTSWKGRPARAIATLERLSSSISPRVAAGNAIGPPVPQALVADGSRWTAVPW